MRVIPLIATVPAWIEKMPDASLPLIVVERAPAPLIVKLTDELVIAGSSPSDRTYVPVGKTIVSPLGPGEELTAVSAARNEHAPELHALDESLVVVTL